MDHGMIRILRSPNEPTVDGMIRLLGNLKRKRIRIQNMDPNKRLDIAKDFNEYEEKNSKFNSNFRSL